MAPLSLNQVTRQISGFAKSHGQINAESFGRPVNEVAQGEVLYPAFYYVLTNTRKEVNELVYLFRGEVANRITPEGNTEADVWSDAILIACDILAFLDSDDRDFTLESAPTITPFTEAGGDLLAGVQFDFTLRVPFPYNRCIAPVKDSDTDYLVTEDGRSIITESGQKIRIETVSGQLIYAESGQPLILEDGQTLKIEE